MCKAMNKEGGGYRYLKTIFSRNTYVINKEGIFDGLQFGREVSISAGGAKENDMEECSRMLLRIFSVTTDHQLRHSG